MFAILRRACTSKGLRCCRTPGSGRRERGNAGNAARNRPFLWSKRSSVGTGDAVNAAREYLENDDAVLLVLSGDVPVIRAETLAALIQLHRNHRGKGAACTILTVKLKDPTGYGRIVRDYGGIFDHIVEQRDATPDEAEINEINSGIYCFNARKLFQALSRVGNHNDQGEYYLTDVPGLLKADGEDVAIYNHADAAEVEGVNNRVQLAELERQIRRRTVSRLMLDYGVSFIDPWAAYVSEQTSIGRDTVIHSNVTIEGRTEIGDGCVIRPGSRIVNSRIGRGVEIRDNCLIVDSEIADGAKVGPMAHLRGHAEIGPRRSHWQFCRGQKEQDRPQHKSQSSDISRRCDHRRKYEHRSGNHHLQLRWRPQKRNTYWQ